MALQKEIYNLLRQSNKIKNVIGVFCNVYDLAAHMCPTITPKSEDFLRKRWNALRTAESRKNRTKVVLRVPPAKKIEQDLFPHVEETLAVPSEKSAEAQQWGTSIMPIAALVQRNERLASCVAVSAAGDVSTPSLPRAVRRIAGTEIELIDDATREHLRQFAASLPRSKGKWALVFSEFQAKHPTTNLDAEKLRCRLKAKRQSRKRALDPPPQEQTAAAPTQLAAEPLKRSRTKPPGRAACQSCRDLHHKCGPDSTNRKCQHRQTEDPRITAFFAAAGRDQAAVGGDQAK
ncbi:hypothetical protein PHYSODRAFT_293017 [Phytophthora sojae]|uniref:Uncharacterized protein n=1 Tax=Phytophthora sojae (strain P6497) TaxID=1094619 RepID=G4YEE1_PHYSP|nr:hypothetical protein PHYSODRAFT_293017 [Phytophthora sojae]EGZ26848.1 hypothetical protein PHYSODRAFT_293017 [Phytophthora sojae]|eukprot:XP_009514123.1 hypothetical protein PHYSODRAFT_293017 [Phytophthora sojae]